MNYIQDMRQLNGDESRPSIVTIGKFDGFHLGHQKILREARALRNGDRQVVLVTFSQSPQLVMAGRSGAALHTHEEKLAAAEQLGVDCYVECPFTDEMRHMSAERFLMGILIRKLHACAIVAGPDCRFGYERRGDIDFLRSYAGREIYELRVVEKERYQGEPISSTRIREALSKGRTEDAAAMLGVPFGYRTRIVHGRQLGRKLGFPTINQVISPEKILPAFGVYAVEISLEGRTLRGIANVGVKPTVSGGNAAGVETSIFDFDEDVYGREVQVSLLHFVRPEKRFDSVEQLKTQVEKDKESVRDYFARLT